MHRDHGSVVDPCQSLAATFEEATLTGLLLSEDAGEFGGVGYLIFDRLLQIVQRRLIVMPDVAHFIGRHGRLGSTIPVCE